MHGLAGQSWPCQARLSRSSLGWRGTAARGSQGWSRDGPVSPGRARLGSYRSGIRSARAARPVRARLGRQVKAAPSMGRSATRGQHGSPGRARTAQRVQARLGGAVKAGLAMDGPGGVRPGTEGRAVKARHPMARQSWEWRGLAARGSRGMAVRGTSRLGIAGPGFARPSWPGAARDGWARRGAAGQRRAVGAWRGSPGLGVAWQSRHDPDWTASLGPARRGSAVVARFGHAGLGIAGSGSQGRATPG